MTRRIPSNAIWIAGLLLLLWGKQKRKAPRSPWEPQPDDPGKKKRKVPAGDVVPQFLSFGEIRELAAAVGVEDPDTAAAIAMAESSGNTQAIGKKNHNDIGLWQINLDSCPKEFKNKQLLLTAGFNAQAMASMSNNGTNWTPWKSFTSGAYKKYLSSEK